MEDPQPRIAPPEPELPAAGARARAAVAGPVRVLGRWTTAQLSVPGVWQALDASLQTVPPVTGLAWDLRLVQRLDHIGAQLLWNHWGRQWPAQLQTLPSQRSVLESVARFSVQLPAPPRRSFMQLFEALGERVLQVLEHARGFTILLGQLLLDTLRLLRRPHQGPWRDISGHIYRMGTTALPITAIVGFLIGVVLAYLMAQQLHQFGADTFIVDILGIALIRELGPVLAAVLMAGRSGSAITAQIGVMRVTEELDAMRVMGIAPGFRLVLPRAIAMALAMPLVSVWTTLLALAGGILAADLTLNLSPSYFVHALPDAVELSNLAIATGKSVVFGLVIALVGCHYGLRVKPNTESLGAGTTRSVVTAITLVIVVDALFAIVFSDVGV